MSLRDALTKALLEVWRYADEGLSITNKRGVKVGQDVPPIWRSIDKEETGIIVDALLRAGAANPYVAVAVRGISDAYKQLEVGIILVPRFIETWKFYSGYGFGVPTNEHGQRNQPYSVPSAGPGAGAYGPSGSSGAY